MPARYRLAGLAFLVAVAYWPGLAAAFFMPRWWVIALGLPIVSCLDPRRVYRPILWCALAGLCWGAATLLWAPRPHAGALDLYFLTLLCLTAVAAAQVDDLRPVLAAMGWGVSISSGLVVLQAMGWHPVPQAAADPAGLLLNTEVLAELAAPLIVWAALERRWWLAVALATGYFPVAHHSRIAPLVIAAGLLYGWRAPRRWLKPVIVGAIVPMLPALLVVGGDWKLSSAWIRVGLWLTALQSIAPAGNGLAWWAAAHPFPYEDMAHSDVLQGFVEIGVCALLFLAIPGMVFARSLGSFAERAGFLAVFIETLVSFPLHIPATGFLAALLAGFLSRAGNPVHRIRFAGGIDAHAGFRRAAAQGVGMARRS